MIRLVHDYVRDLLHLAARRLESFLVYAGRSGDAGLDSHLAGAMLLYTHLVWSARSRGFLFADRLDLARGRQRLAARPLFVELLLVDQVRLPCCGPSTSRRWWRLRC